MEQLSEGKAIIAGGDSTTPILSPMSWERRIPRNVESKWLTLYSRHSMVKWLACNLLVEEIKAKDGHVNSCRALIKPKIRSHSILREISSKGLKAEGKPSIDQLKCSNITIGRGFQMQRLY